MLRLSCLILAASAATANAGWDNVFQLACCDTPRSSYSHSYSVPVAPAPVAVADNCPPQPCEPQARVSYIQRCYYQPETTYRNESYYVPVKETVKSYYYAPVTSYRYTSYYDPCTGCCQRIATPCTSYERRERCCSVTKWVEQCRAVPVTSYRAVTMYTPVVTYYYPPVSSPSAFKVPLAPPRVDEQRAPEVVPVIPKTNLPTDPQSAPKTMPKASGASNAYTASRTKAIVRGELVANDQATPRPGTKVIFLSAADNKTREETVTNAFGEFDVKLPAGEWYVYLGQGDGRANFHKKLTIQPDDVRDLTLVSR